MTGSKLSLAAKRRISRSKDNIIRNVELQDEGYKMKNAGWTILEMVQSSARGVPPLGG